MKKYGKKLVSMCLALVMLIAMVPAVNVTNVQAATKKEKLTLYKGEVLTETYYGATVKSVSSSKKSVVSVKKQKGSTNKADLTAKKTGTATVTVKTSSMTYKYTVTVKKMDVTGKLSYMGDSGELLLTVKNNTKQTFDSVTLSYTLKGADGDVITKDTKTIYDVVAGKTVFSYLSYDNRNYTLDLSQCTVKAAGDSRSISYTYTDASKKVKTTVTPEWDGSNIKFSIKSKNTDKTHTVSGYNYIRVYDEDGNLVDLISDSIYLKAGAVNSTTRSSYFSSSIDTSGYTYKVTTVAYYYTY